MLGEFRKDPKSREEFLSLIQRNWKWNCRFIFITAAADVAPVDDCASNVYCYTHLLNNDSHFLCIYAANR